MPRFECKVTRTARYETTLVVTADTEADACAEAENKASDLALDSYTLSDVDDPRCDFDVDTIEVCPACGATDTEFPRQRFDGELRAVCPKCDTQTPICAQCGDLAVDVKVPCTHSVLCNRCGGCLEPDCQHCAELRDATCVCGEPKNADAETCGHPSCEAAAGGES